MSDHSAGTRAKQGDLFEAEGVRSLLDQLLADSRLYTRSKDYKALLDFVVRLRNFAPFNAMLLQVQKPGLSHAASARDWRLRFRRHPKEGARPLLVLLPFAPVALVYDVDDTEGEELPQDVSSFFARGSIDEASLKTFPPLLRNEGIDLTWVDAGDRHAGYIRVAGRASGRSEATRYRIGINRNHAPAARFATLAHELAHLFLGHLGPDKPLAVPERPRKGHAQQELEAESVAYVVCERNGVHPRSQTYLSRFVTADTTVDRLDVYQVMRAAGRVEALLGLAAHTRYDRAGR